MRRGPPARVSGHTRGADPARRRRARRPTTRRPRPRSIHRGTAVPGTARPPGRTGRSTRASTRIPASTDPSTSSAPAAPRARPPADPSPMPLWTTIQAPSATTGRRPTPQRRRGARRHEAPTRCSPPRCRRVDWGHAPHRRRRHQRRRPGVPPRPARDGLRWARGDLRPARPPCRRVHPGRERDVPPPRIRRAARAVHGSRARPHHRRACGRRCHLPPPRAAGVAAHLRRGAVVGRE